MLVTKLQNYEPTEALKKLLPQGEDKYGKYLEINGPSGHFKMKARLVCDYHVEELLKREDNLAKKYFKAKGATQPKTPTSAVVGKK